MMSSWRNVAHIVNHWSPDAHQQNFSSQMFLVLGCFLSLSKRFIRCSCSPSPAWWLPAAEPASPVSRPPQWLLCLELSTGSRRGGRCHSASRVVCPAFPAGICAGQGSLLTACNFAPAAAAACQAEAGREGAWIMQHNIFINIVKWSLRSSLAGKEGALNSLCTTH